MKKLLLERLAWLLLFWTLIIAVQWRSGAYAVETVRHSDESAHLLNSVLVRDYLALGLGQNPLEFVKQYYLHYPAIAPLVWPPLFHIATGLWMLPFGASAASAVVFVGLTGAVALLLFFELSRRELGVAAGLIMTLTLGGLPLFIDLATSIMLDMFVLAASLAFTWACARMLEAPSSKAWRVTGLTGGFWGGAKANGLAALPALGTLLLIGRDRTPGWRRSLGAAAIICVLSLPQALISFALLRGHNPPQPSGMDAMFGRLIYYADNARWQMGWWTLALAAIGVATMFIRRSSATTASTAVLATLAGTVLFHAVLPQEHNERYLAPMLPPILFFAVLSARMLSWKYSSPAAACLVAMFVLPGRFNVPLQTPDGWRQTAAWIRVNQPRLERVMVFSEERGETAFVAEMAVSNSLRSDYVVRGSKTAAESNWYGGDYRALANEPQQLAALIEDYGIEEVVIDHSAAASNTPEVGLAIETMQQMPARFPLQTSVAGARRITVHRVAHHADPPRKRISYNLSRSLDLTVSETGSQAR